MQNQKGFTIIELIVVIAIIAVLAAVVAVNVTQYMAKAKNVAIKENVNKVFYLALDYYLANGKYDGFCNSEERVQITIALRNIFPNYYEVLGVSDIEGCSDPVPGGVHELTGCDNRAGEWQFMSYLMDGSVYCVDYTGDKLTIGPGLFNPRSGTCECANSYN